MHYQYNQLGWPRLGLVVAAKTARLSAHRNYMRRVLRELFRAQQRNLKNVDLVVRTQKTFASTDYSVVEKEFTEMLSKLRRQTEQQKNG